MWGAFVSFIESLLHILHDAVGNWGMAIILFTVFIKVITWPLTSKQIKSSKGMQELQPKMKELQEKYKDDKEAQTREMMKLYQEMGVNPLMGCLPMLIQFPIWIALYQAILNLASGDGPMGQEGFLFLPSLAEPGRDIQGLGWVLDVGNWAVTWPYLILPVLTVVTQLLISKLMTPTPAANAKNDDPTQAIMKQMMYIMPIMFGFFALQFPAGLALYWVTNNVLMGVQYAVLNRESTLSALSLAPVAAGDGVTVVEPQGDSTNYSKGQTDGKSRRKRKKR